MSCSAQSGVTTIGLEWVAKQCIPDGMNDTVSVYYENNMLECPGTTVSLYAWYGDTQATPAAIATYWKNQGYRVFRNKEGSHIVAVHKYYTGLIDGKSMASYPTGQIYTDVFKEALYPTTPVPDCRGGDFNAGCPLEKPANSSVNVGTGRLSHDQELFATRSSQPLALAVSLSYRSVQFTPSAIGSGWSHGYEMSLQNGAGTSKVFWQQGVRRIYNNFNGTYVSPRGDFSTLVKNADNTFTITEKDGLKRNFDTAGVATSLVDRNNNTLTFGYTDGRLTSVTDPNGRSATFAYDGNGKLQTVTDPRNNVYTFVYTDGKLTGVTNPDSGQWLYSYGVNGLLATKSDPEHNLASYGYDTNNRLISTTDPAGMSRSYAFPAVVTNTGKIPDPYPASMLPQKQLVFTEKDGSGWTSVYDTLTETIRSATDPLGNVTSYTYDSQGNMLTRTEPGIGTTTYTYDSKGNILTLRDPLNQTTTYTYNGFGQILTITGAPGNTTNTYDTSGNLLTTTDPTGALTQYGYDSKGNLTTITDARGKVTTLAYDAASNDLTSITLPTTAVIQFSSDANGNILTTTDALGKVTTSTYDGRNRLATVTDPLGHVTTHTYDKNGNRSTTTDANSKVTTYTHNFQNQLTGIRDALDNVTGFTYGVAGCPTCTGVDQLTTLTDARSQTTSWTYDKLGRLLTEADPLSKTTTFGYGATPRPSSKTDANGVTIGYTYDNLQRLTLKTYPAGATEGITYDSRNNILTATNANISYTFTYDGANRIKSATDSRGYAISYDYDNNGNRTGMTLQPGTADERVITYSYDDASRLATMTTPAGLFTFGYDPNNRRISLAYPNQITATYTYDDSGSLTGLTHTRSDSSIVASAGYTLDNVGNRTAKSGTTAETYAYDAIYRLLQAVTPRGSENFTYDAVGNRTSGPGPRDTRYQHDAANRMTTGRQYGYTYDNNGNQTMRTTANPDKNWTLGWDYENRLTGMERIKGAEKRTVTFTYDPFGRRIEKKLITIVAGVTKTTTTTYVYDNEDIAIEITNDGTTTTTTRYLHGPGIDEPLAMERNGQFSFYHADGLGSITAMTDTSRNVIQRYTYESFGTPRPTTNFRNGYQYTAREWDKETGLYYYRARYYDPVEGRFISKDPFLSIMSSLGASISTCANNKINMLLSLHPYSYVDSNPIVRTDPEGLFWMFDCIKCFYYMNKCAKEGLKCKKEKCQQNDLPPTSGELFNDCYKGIPACQKQLEYCGKCSLSAQGSPTRGGR